MTHPRRRLKGTGIAGFLLIAFHRIVGAAEPISADAWREFIAEAATRYAVSEALIRAVMHAESGGDTRPDRRSVTSSAGAMGLMQLMPETYAELRERYGFGIDPFDPHDNILAGAAYLQEMQRRFGWPYFLAAYQAGPRRVDEYLTRGIPLPPSTTNYVSNIHRSLGLNSPDLESSTSAATSATASLFARVNVASSMATTRVTAVIPLSIFVPLQRTDRRRIRVDNAREPSPDQPRE